MALTKKLLTKVGLPDLTSKNSVCNTWDIHEEKIVHR